MQTILAIAAGGAIGSVVRHLLNNGVAAFVPSGFPWGILACNVIGSTLMGVLIGVFALSAEASAPWRAFLMVGVLGGFTTFSAFSADTILLWERGAFTQAALYVALSVGLSLAGLVAGLACVRGILS
ncbi:fluoride efflux transporter CrcB [Micavibrio aeruginosavorus]|uniref:Fluoride-specific ion channel FluC n=1 Tax=Micavibrio aeruginosavorus EPB TaxID=349215 RepID=M4VL36_9BACT|nr:fluoride efflux transporter CrcB [Micavibrio aeruginosavorus]AGH98826.1 Protein crcB-like protein [Micavibrio aeruginosavorus EPB]